MKTRNIGPAVVFDMEHDKNPKFGVYLSEEGNIRLEAPICFSSGKDGTYTGKLKDRPYFMVDGKDIDRGRELIEEIVQKYNTNASKSLKGLKGILLERLPEIKTYATHEEYCGAFAQDMKGLALKIGHLEGPAFFKALSELKD